ncbi:hypothetical protein Q7P35_006172 [Cladosporium inversicolor]
MRGLTLLALAGTSLAMSRNPAHVNKRYLLEQARPATHLNTRSAPPTYGSSNTSYIIPQNANTTKFAVDGNAIPDVNFDIGESYAGLLPISDKANASELFFWFQPSANELAGDEILIWLNGGPGCSSLEGFLQENGPFLWQYGTYQPVKNNWAWSNLTNIVWVEQPAGTGFSHVGSDGAPKDEIEVAAQFLGWFKNFVDTFALQGRKVYITGESYAGYYVPYIADAMHNATDTTYYNVDSIMIYDPSVSYDVITNDIPSVPFVDYWSGLFSFNETFVDHLHEKWESCGYADFYEEALTFPPKGPLPNPTVGSNVTDCSLWNEVYNAALLVNPCWDVYQVATTCPLLWDVLGFPGSFGYLPEGASVYFNRTEVQKAINAPVQEWEECSNGVLDDDTSPPSGLSVLPRVIEKNKRTVIGHGMLDFILLANGTLMTIQNMTWNGAQGFSSYPENDFFVPYHDELNLGSLGGSGNFGKWHTERGLTFVTIDLSGHMVPQYAPTAAYRQLEFLLGRIENLGERSDFTTQSGNFGNEIAGNQNATVKHH